MPAEFGRVRSEMWGGLYFTGLLVTVVGIIGSLNSAIAGVVSAVFLGVPLALAGIFQLGLAARLQRAERGYLVLSGVLSLVCGAI